VLIYTSGMFKGLRLYSRSIIISFQRVLQNARHTVAALVEPSNV